MGIYFAHALMIVGLAWAGSAAQAQGYKNQAQFACGGVNYPDSVNPTKASLDQLDRELSHANKTLKNPASLQGRWVYRFKFDDEGQRPITLTIELKIMNGFLHSRLIEWGEGRFTSDWAPVARDQDDRIDVARGFLKILYQDAYSIYIRPISKTEMRYGFMDSCEINFPSFYSKVFTRKQ